MSLMRRARVLRSMKKRMTPQETAKSNNYLIFHWNSDEFNQENGTGQHQRALKFSKKEEGILIFTSGGLDSSGEVTNPFKEQPLYHAARGIPRLLK